MLRPTVNSQLNANEIILKKKSNSLFISFRKHNSLLKIHGLKSSYHDAISAVDLFIIQSKK